MPRPLSVTGVLTLEDPTGRVHRLVAENGRLRLDLSGMRSLSHVYRLAPNRRLRARMLEALLRGFEHADVTLEVSVRGRTMARLSPGVPAGLLGRWLGIPGLRLLPVAFLFHPRP